MKRSVPLRTEWQSLIKISAKHVVCACQVVLRSLSCGLRPPSGSRSIIKCPATSLSVWYWVLCTEFNFLKSWDKLRTSPREKLGDAPGIHQLLPNIRAQHTNAQMKAYVSTASKTNHPHILALHGNEGSASNMGCLEWCLHKKKKTIVDMWHRQHFYYRKVIDSGWQVRTHQTHHSAGPGVSQLCFLCHWPPDTWNNSLSLSAIGESLVMMSPLS